MEDGLCTIFDCEGWAKKAEDFTKNLEIGPDWSDNKAPLNGDRRQEMLAKSQHLDTDS